MFLPREQNPRRRKRRGGIREGKKKGEKGEGRREKENKERGRDEPEKDFETPNYIIDFLLNIS